ncbi:ribosome maturation protein RimP [Candidatus Nanopelagicaceae bacterium]
MALKDSIADLIRPVVEDAGFFLEDVFTSNPGNHRIVTCMVDGLKPLSLDEVTVVSRSISEILDETPLLTEAFTLEVTSPGIERPITLPRHWTKNLTRIVKVVLNDDTEVSGRLTEFDETRAILIENIKGRMKSHEVNFADIKRANVEIEFNRKDEI